MWLFRKNAIGIFSWCCRGKGQFMSLPGAVGTPPLPPLFSYPVLGMKLSENPLGRVWSITVDELTKEKFDTLKDIEGIVVCTHQKGKQSQNPHYHIYYESPKEIRREKLKEVLKAMDEWKPIFTYKGKTAQYRFSTKPEYTLESYWRYIWEKRWKEPKLLIWNHSTPEFEIPPDPVDEITHYFKDELSGLGVFYTKFVPEKKTTRKTTEQKLEEFYIKKVKPYFEEFPGEEISRESVKTLFYEHFKGGLQKIQALQMYCDYAIYRLCEEGGESRKERKEYFFSRWMSDSEKFYPN